MHLLPEINRAEVSVAAYAAPVSLFEEILARSERTGATIFWKFARQQN
jgi:hypothetical protein